MSEAELQDAVIELAHLLKWRVAHFRAAKTDKGWRTPVSADGKGFPDLVMVRAERLIFAELKSEKGRVSIPQIHWLNALEECGRAEVVLWRPEHWLDGSIERQLQAR